MTTLRTPHIDDAETAADALGDAIVVCHRLRTSLKTDVTPGSAASIDAATAEGADVAVALDDLFVSSIEMVRGLVALCIAHPVVPIGQSMASIVCDLRSYVGRMAWLLAIDPVMTGGGTTDVVAMSSARKRIARAQALRSHSGCSDRARELPSRIDTAELADLITDGHRFVGSGMEPTCIAAQCALGLFDDSDRQAPDDHRSRYLDRDLTIVLWRQSLAYLDTAAGLMRSYYEGCDEGLTSVNGALAST